MKKGSVHTKATRARVSAGLKEYFKSHNHPRKGTSKYANPKEAYHQIHVERRKNVKYYKNELRDNAFRGKGKGYGDTEKRRKEIAVLAKKKALMCGFFKPKGWDESEIEYLKERYKTDNVEHMAIDLERSFSSISHKLARLGLRQNYQWTT